MGIFRGIGKTNFPKNGIPPAGGDYFSENVWTHLEIFLESLILTGSGQSIIGNILVGNFGPLVKTNLAEIWFPPARGERFPEVLKNLFQNFAEPDCCLGLASQLSSNLLWGVRGHRKD